MLKNNKGITLIALVITIIVLMILVSISVSTGLDTAKESRYYNAISQMKVMQAKVNEFYEEYSNGDETTKNKILEYGQSIADSQKNEQATKAYVSVKQTDSSVAGNIEDYRYYDVNYINDTLDIDGIDYDFIINIKLRTVILVDGIQRNETTYYSFCQIPGEQYNVQYVE